MNVAAILALALQRAVFIITVVFIFQERESHKFLYRKLYIFYKILIKGKEDGKKYTLVGKMKKKKY